MLRVFRENLGYLLASATVATFLLSVYSGGAAIRNHELTRSHGLAFLTFGAAIVADSAYVRRRRGSTGCSKAFPDTLLDLSGPVGRPIPRGRREDVVLMHRVQSAIGVVLVAAGVLITLR